MQGVTFRGRILQNKGDSFILGTGKGIRLNCKNEIILQENISEGSYESPEINSNKFMNLVASWNAETPEGTEIEVLFKIRKEGIWSRWFSYGKWSSDENRGSIKDQKDDIAYMDIDTLKINGGNEADGFKYRVIMTRKGIDYMSPKVKAIFAALRLVESEDSELNTKKNWLRELEVPERSQMIIPKIGNIICSPTSLSMVMEYYGKKMKTEEVAKNVMDNGAGIYGNWSYNVAYAGSKGFHAFIDRFTSTNSIKNKIAEGIPVVASIGTKSKEDLTGSPMAYPSGHLIVIRGFTIKDGEEYVIVNDPAAPNYDTVRREYKLSEFEKAWCGITYILKPDFEYC